MTRFLALLLEDIYSEMTYSLQETLSQSDLKYLETTGINIEFLRSEQVRYHPIRVREFKRIVNDAIQMYGIFECPNRYEYDRVQVWEDLYSVDTLHVTLRYDRDTFATKLWKEEIIKLKNTYRESGYYIQENSMENKSIPEFEHFHLIMILWEWALIPTSQD